MSKCIANAVKMEFGHFGHLRDPPDEGLLDAFESQFDFGACFGARITSRDSFKLYTQLMNKTFELKPIQMTPATRSVVIVHYPMLPGLRANQRIA